MEDDDDGDNKGIRAAVRSAKKAIRPTPIGMPEARHANPKSKSKAKAKARTTPKPSAGKKGGAFDRDMGEKRGNVGLARGAGREGARAKKGDKIGGMGKKGQKRGKGK